MDKAEDYPSPETIAMLRACMETLEVRKARIRAVEAASEIVSAARREGQADG